MINIQDYIGKHFVGKKLHLACNCIMKIDITGICTGYDISGNEVILKIKTGDKQIPIGLNTPKLKIEVF